MNKERISRVVKEILAKKRTGKPDEEVFNKWKKLINMSVKELKSFMKSEDGQKAGLSESEADKLGINSGRESASMILKMLPHSGSFKEAERNWTPSMWYWAKRQNSFNSRMLGNKGPLFDDKKKKTRKHLSLLIWGHNPMKKKGSFEVNADQEFKTSVKVNYIHDILIKKYLDTLKKEWKLDKIDIRDLDWDWKDVVIKWKAVFPRSSAVLTIQLYCPDQKISLSGVVDYTDDDDKDHTFNFDMDLELKNVEVEDDKVKIKDDISPEELNYDNGDFTLKF